MKTLYISPALRVIMEAQDIVTGSTPDGFHNEVKPGEGLAPGRNIWESNK